MAAGSEKFMWKLFPGLERVCRECGRELKIDDVREHRTLYPSNKTDFWCKDCHARWLDARLEARRSSS